MGRSDMSRMAAWARRLAPYFLVELLLPGGSIIALLLWLHGRNHGGDSA